MNGTRSELRNGATWFISSVLALMPIVDIAIDCFDRNRTRFGWRTVTAVSAQGPALVFSTECV